MNAMIAKLEKLEAEIRAAAKLAVRNGMFESGAGLRNKADGVKASIALIRAEGNSPKTEVEALFAGSAR